jgi:hypothetical protein
VDCGSASPQEIAEAKVNLAKVGNKANYVMISTGSPHMHRHLVYTPNQRLQNQGLIALFDWIEDSAEFMH